jgi:RHH-type proline utilization regulon transcriptional repressor/proline dehydrogenase/delta 1-pyrroline-5-carboxylate dehydrogenase
VVANSKNANSQSLRQLIAQRDGSIIPLIQWPKSNKDYNYHWLLSFLSERTRTENLVARGGNTQLFNLAE